MRRSILFGVALNITVLGDEDPPDPEGLADLLVDALGEDALVSVFVSGVTTEGGLRAHRTPSRPSPETAAYSEAASEPEPEPEPEAPPE